MLGSLRPQHLYGAIRVQDHDLMFTCHDNSAPADLALGREARGADSPMLTLTYQAVAAPGG